MRLTGTQEWIVIGVLIAYIAFMPGFPMVRQFLSTGLGKALGLALVVWVAKNVSVPVALLLVVNFVRCAGMREYADDASMKPATPVSLENAHCPEPKDNYRLENNQCVNKITGMSSPATICLAGQTWDGTKCAGSSTPSAPPPPPPSTTKQPFTLMSAAPYGGVQPDVKEKFKGGLEFAPV